MAVAASLKALVTLQEVANYLNKTLASLKQGHKDDLQRLINAVSEAVEGHCGPLMKTEVTEYHDGGRQRIFLRRLPVDSSATLTVLEDGETLTPAADGSSETAAGSTPDFWLDPDTGVLERNGTTWASGRRIVKVTYTGGRCVQKTTDDAVRTDTSQPLESVEGPDDLREAVLILVKTHTDLGPTAFATQFLEGGHVLRPTAWPAIVLRRLSRYRDPVR